MSVIDLNGDTSSTNDGSRTSRLLDYLLLTATIAFAEEFRIDHQRRAEIETTTELNAMLAARHAAIRELSVLNTRVTRILRSLMSGVVVDEAYSLVEAYAVLDIRRIHTAIVRIHRHLMTLYPSVTEELVERVRLFAADLEVASQRGYEDYDSTLLLLLTDTIELADLVRSEIG